MQDLTKGNISKHIVAMAVPIAIGLFIQTLYFLVDLYFVGRLGSEAIAAVSSAGSVFFFVMALTQVLNIGCATLVSHAVGRKDHDEANHLCNQALALASWATLLFTVFGYLFADYFFSFMAADVTTQTLAKNYFYYFLPSLLMQFVFTALSAALRGTGVVKPVMTLSIIGVIANIILSPILITGWGLGIELGVAGAGLASSVSMALSFVLLIGYFNRQEQYLRVDWLSFSLNIKTVRKILNIGLPSGGEFFLTFLYMSIIYWALSRVSAEAQAGFGLGSRIMQSLFLPVMAIAFAAPAIAGQNYAAGKIDRVYKTFTTTALLTCGLMALLMLLCLWVPSFFVSGFSESQQVILIAATFLSFVGVNFVPAGYVFAISGMFQALGNTWPALLSTFTRLSLFAISVIYLVYQDNFYIEQIWYCSIATVFIQAAVSHLLLKREFQKKLIRNDDNPLTQPSLSRES